MGKKVKFKAIIDRADVPDINGNRITKKALKGVAPQLASRLDGIVDILLLLRFDPTKVIGRVREIKFDAEKGELSVKGWVDPDYVSPTMKCAPQYKILKMSYVQSNTPGKPDDMVFEEVLLIACGLTEDHSDPGIPPIEIGEDQDDS